MRLFHKRNCGCNLRDGLHIPLMHGYYLFCTGECAKFYLQGFSSSFIENGDSMKHPNWHGSVAKELLALCVEMVQQGAPLVDCFLLERMTISAKNRVSERKSFFYY